MTGLFRSMQNDLTAEEFEKSPEPIQVNMVIDEEFLLLEQHGNMFIFSQGCLRFTIRLETTVLFVGNKEEIRTSLTMDVGATEPANWNLIYQMRVSLGRLSVDQFNVDFTPTSRPLLMDVLDETVTAITIQMRTINRNYYPLPRFDEGDIAILFDNEPPLRTWRSLLTYSSTYMTEKLAAAPEATSISLGSFPRVGMEELLLQLYPTNWPFYINFPALAKTAAGFNVEHLIYKLGRHLVEHIERPTLKKWHTAMSCELSTALLHLVYEDVRSGNWDRRCSTGFTPEAFFTKPVYQSLICPVILAARSLQPRPDDSKLVAVSWIQPNYFEPSPDKQTLLFCRTHFHLNRGVLASHGGRIGSEYELVFSPHMELYCARENLIPGRVLIAVLNSLHPDGPQVPTSLLKAALILCHDQNWIRVKERLEQRLLHEPTMTTEQLAEQLVFAEHFGLENTLRALVLRVETSCAKMAKELLEKPSEVTDKSRDLLKKRLADGWSAKPLDKKCQYWVIGTRKTTIRRHRRLSTAPEDLNSQMTLAGLDSNYALDEEVIQIIEAV